MAYKITSECVNCGACESECPVEAISEKGDVRVINADLCTSCGSCAAACPASAIEAG
ncbi:MAG: 4Fe-4S binding protein [Spirochaetales bacterium]|jgi:ferredoxin|nr:4Fe-4S binding protein [Spirochaetales bacterium]